MKKQNNSILILLVITFASGIFTACRRQTTLTHQFQSVQDKGWVSNDSMIFHFNIDTVPQIVEVQMQIRHRSDYPYKDLYVAIGQNFSDSNTMATDTVHLRLTDENDNWLGKGIGYLYQHSIPIKRYTAEHRGAHKFTVIPLMSDSILTGIHDIGIKLDAIEN